MRTFSVNFSLSTRILLTVVGILTLVVGLMCALVAADHYHDARGRLLAEAASKAELTAYHAAPALAGGDRAAARIILGSFRAVPDVSAARLFDLRGQLVAEYSIGAAAAPVSPFDPPVAGHRFLPNRLEVYRPVMSEGKLIGLLAVVVDLTTFRYEFVGFSIKAILISTLVLVVAYLLTAAAARSILQPIGVLASAMRRVFDEKHEDIRLPVKRGDEAGMLAQGFNILLERVAERETSLRRELAERNQTQRRLDELAHYDPVTKLPNRHYFLRQLERLLLESAKAGSAGALLLIDLNKLKQVNETLGHDAGDSLLLQFARRLQANLREHDTLCRLGGDQYALLLDQISGESHLVTVANKLLSAARQPVILGEREIQMSSSIGIAVFPVDGNEPQALIRHAETALQRAKAGGRNSHVFFTPDMLEHEQQWANLGSELKRALDENELRLHLQPQVNLQDGRLRGLEALLRWQHPEHGLLLPGEFMPLAEENIDIIQRIGDWTLAAACAQIAEWRASGLQPVPIAVNVSSAQLRDTRVVHRVREMLTRQDVPAEYLELEIAENLLISEPGAGEALEQLRKLGTRITVDHFGAGYSSLSHLKDLPVTALKIDREFVHGVTESAKYAAITRAIVSLATDMGLDTVAEGVESTRQVEFLRAMGCRAYQGFCFSPAVPPEEATRFLVAHGTPLRLAYVNS